MSVCGTSATVPYCTVLYRTLLVQVAAVLQGAEALEPPWMDVGVVLVVPQVRRCECNWAVLRLY